jgi:hypothetical protein
MGYLVELEDPGHRGLEHRAVVRDDHGAARTAADEVLEASEPVEIEVVRRLVEEQEREARQQDRGERGASGFAARQRGHRDPERRGIEPELAARRLRARLEVRATEREPGLQRGGVGVTGLVGPARERIRRRLERRRRSGDAGAARQEGEQHLAGAAVGLLGEIARRAAAEAHVSRVGRFDAREDPQQRRLPRAVRTHDAEHVAWRHHDGDVLEDDMRAVRLGDPVGGEDTRARHEESV